MTTKRPTKREIQTGVVATSWLAINNVFMDAINKQLEDSYSFKQLGKKDRQIAQEFALEFSLTLSKLLITAADKKMHIEEEADHNNLI